MPGDPKRMPQGYSLSLQAPVAWELGPPSPQEAAPLPRHGALQIGVRRAVPAGWLSSAAGATLPDGRHVWLAALRAEGAVALRAHFQDFSVGAGQVWLYDTRHASVAGPYTGRGLFGTGEFWSSTIASDEVVVEFDAPAGTSRAALPFRIDAISHQWTSILAPAAAGRDTAASCELDVSCYPDWAQYASGVVLYTFAGDTGGYYQCSGALLNPAGVAFAPYMLTANHCISSASEARNANLLFGYQTSVCNGTPADIHLLGFESGTTYLAGAPFEEGDYTLLALTEPAPEGVYLFGWTTTAPNIGDPVVGIHHPMGSWARISFGIRDGDAPVDISGSIVPANVDYQVTYEQGVIEPGSSGSPLLNSNAEVVGTASGALVPNPSVSVCDSGPVRAAYGRLSVAYPALEQYLNGNVNPAPAFSVSPASLVFDTSNGQPTGGTGSVQVTTSSLTPVPFSVQAADPWLTFHIQTDALHPPTLINADTPVDIVAGVGNPALYTDGTYNSSLTVTVGTGAPVTIPATLNVANAQSRVFAAVNADLFPSNAEPVIPRMPGGSTTHWRFMLGLTETAGVATTITSLTIAGQDISSHIPSLFGSASIPPAGYVSAVVDITNVAYNQNNTIEIDGVDPGSGISWSQAFNVQFADPAGSVSSLLASGLPALVYPDAAAPDCPIRQHIILQSVGDSPVSLTALSLADGGPDVSSLLSSFASTYIPAGGSIQGDLCWPNTYDRFIYPWNGLLLDLSATDSNGAQITDYPGVVFSVPPSAARLSVNTTGLQFASPKPPATTVSVDPGSSTLAWSAIIVYDQSPAAWLSLTPTAGMGPATMQVSVNPAGLIPGGVYRASLIIQSLNSTPQYQSIPVTFQAPSTGIAVVNSASFAAGVAPGMAVSLFDAGVILAGGTEAAGAVPLPIAMQGTTVAVNNIPAPLYYVSPTQLNAQIPYEVPPGPATLTISNAKGQIASQAIYVNAVAPGVFVDNDRKHVVPNVPAKPGGYATLYLTGQGPVSPAVATGAAPPNPDQVPVSGLPHPFARVQVLVNGVQAQTSFVGIPYYLAGVTQVNFIVPPATPSGDQPVIVTVAGVPANTAYINISQ
jgi:uncharacterized protein (TIGR03437 family)